MALFNMRCAFPACDHDSSQNTTQRVTFHRVPDEESLRAVWMEALGQTDWTPEPGSVVCSEHILLKDVFGTSTEHPLKLCRICFTTDCKMYSMTSFTMLNKAYENVTGILTAEEEHLPRYLCGQCAGRLMNCARFRRRSLRAHSMLLDIVRTHGQINVDLIKSELQKYNPFSSDPADNSNGERFEIEYLDDVNKQTDARVDESPEDVKVTVDQNHIYREDGSIHVAMDEFKTENEDLNNVGESHLGDIVCDSIIENSDTINLTVKIENSEVIDKESPSDEQTASHMASTGEDEMGDLTKLDGLGAKTMKKTRRVVNEVEADEQQTPEADGLSTDDMLRCDICHYQTDSDIQLLEHLKAHAASNNVRQKRNLQTHQLKHSNEKSYTCDVCKKVFRHKGTLKNHVLMHSNVETYTCDVCKKVLRHKGYLKYHVLIHSNVKPYNCDICNKAFRTKWTLKKHILIHLNEKPYSCDVCNKVFREKGGLKRHQLIHLNLKPYTCDVCSKMFREKAKLKQHQLIHLGLKPYTCDVCNKVFRVKGNLKKHLLIHLNLKPYSCDVCNKQFREKGTLKLHQSIHLNLKSYSCDICNNVFRGKEHLKKHLLIHLNLKLYSCNVCNKEFRNKGNLETHKLIHSNEKPHTCDVCNKVFRHKYTLKSHQLIHSNEKPFTCDVCNTAFRQMSNLKAHKLIHLNLKPHSCDVCNKEFRENGTLKKHKLIHLNLKPYSCDVCNTAFRQKGTLTKHLLIHSPTHNIAGVSRQRTRVPTGSLR